MASLGTRTAAVLSLAVLAAALLVLRPWETDPNRGETGRAPTDAHEAARRNEPTGDEPSPREPTLRGHVAPPTPGAPEAPLAADEGAIAGQVVHAETSEALAGVMVHAVTDHANDARVLASAVSAKDGSFRLRGISSRWFGIQLVATGSDWVNAEVAHGGVRQQTYVRWAVPIRPGEVVPARVRVLPAGSIVGTVHDAEGRPVEGAVVRLPEVTGPEGPAWRQPHFPWHLVPTTTTDVAGRFRLQGLPWGDHVRVEARRLPHLQADSEPVSVRPPEATAAVRIVLPEHRRARVLVVDAETGAAIEKAEVRMRSRRARGPWPRGFTDVAGRVEFDEFPLGASSLRVETYGYATFRSWRGAQKTKDAWDRFQAGADGTYEATIGLQPAARLAGRIVLPDDTYHGFFRVRARPMERTDEVLEASAPVDAQGHFRMTVPPGMRWRIGLEHAVDEWTLPAHLEVESGDESIVLEPRRRTTGKGDEIFDGAADEDQPPAWTIRGQVLDPAGDPAPGVEVETRVRPAPSAEAPEGGPGERHGALTDGEGQFVLRGRGHVDLELYAVRPGAWISPAPIPVAPGRTDVLLRLEEGVEPRLVVRAPSGEALVGAPVFVRQHDGALGKGALHYWAIDKYAESGARGEASPGVLEEGGTYELRVRPPKDLQHRYASTVIEDWTPHDTVIVLQPFEPVSGTVRTPAGRPLEDVCVILNETGYPGLEHAMTTADGHFSFQRVRSGPVRLGAYLPSLEPRHEQSALTLDATSGASDLVLVVDPGRTLRISLPPEPQASDRLSYLRVAPLGARARGIPTHARGIPAGAGAALVHGLREGIRYRVWSGPTRAGGYAMAVVGPGDDEVALAPQPGGTIKGTIIWAPGTEPGRAVVDHEGVFLAEGLLEGDTEFELHGVPDGAWPVTVTWSLDGESGQRTLTASAGDTLTFDLTKPAR